jgi:anti-anti-sigma factor
VRLADVVWIFVMGSTCRRGTLATLAVESGTQPTHRDNRETPMPHLTEARTMPLLEIRVTTPLSAATAGDLDGLLEDAISLRPAQLVIDLTDCEYLDATGIGLLLDVHRRVWQDGGRLSLRGMSSRLQRILEIARVDRVLQAATAPAGHGSEHRRSTVDTATGSSGDATDPS